jgi:molecular chaperone Hsp33
MESNEQDALGEGLTIRNTFVRHRNVLLSEADFSSLYVDYYLHCKDQGLRPPVELDARFKELLAAFTLHCASRPRNEVMAWTIRFTEPLSSFFFAGDTELGTVAGRVFTDHIREDGGNEFYQELKRPRRDLHRSYVDFVGQDAKSAVERFYAQSEQRPGKLFFPGGDRALLATAHPDWDKGWFEALDEAKVTNLAAEEDINLLETRVYRWFCGCSHSKILEVLAPVFKQDAEQLFGAEESIQVNCPRCAAAYGITREALEAYVAEHPTQGSSGK